MDDKYESETFRRMNVVQIKNFLLERGVSVTGYIKRTLIKVASALERMGIPCVPTTSGVQYQTEKGDRLIIHDMEIEMH